MLYVSISRKKFLDLYQNKHTIEFRFHVSLVVGHMLLIIEDEKKIRISQVSSTSSSAIIMILQYAYFCISRNLLSDHIPGFNSVEFDKILSDNDIIRIKTAL